MSAKPPRDEFLIFLDRPLQNSLDFIFFFIVFVAIETLNVPFSQKTFSSCFPQNFVKIFCLKKKEYIQWCILSADFKKLIIYGFRIPLNCWAGVKFRHLFFW